MGVYSSIFIEYKKQNDAEWHLLTAFVPEEFVDHAYYDDSSPDSNHSVTIGEKKLWQMFNIVRQGSVRDLLAGHDSPFNNRGFPEDLSRELAEMFDKVQKKIEERQEIETWPGEWRWGKSWCMLSELTAYVENKLEKCKNSILSEHTKQISFGISAKLDNILAAILGKKIRKKSKNKTEEDEIDNGEMLDYYLSEELEEILCLSGFASGISLVYEFLTDEWLFDTSIRLVFYAC